MQKNKLIRSIYLGERYYAEEKLIRCICLGEWYYAEE